jgi:hypothetical protein
MASPTLKIKTKWDRYKSSYGRNELYWGLGIEEETYVQFCKPLYVAAPLLRTAHAPERYSVRYFLSYKAKDLGEAFLKLFPDISGCVPIPLLLNAYGFQNMDNQYQHRTTYEKVPQPNEKFCGKSIFDEVRSFLKLGYMDDFMFDGDSIEFMTQKFYKARVKGVVQELMKHKQVFLHGLNTWIKQQKLWREFGGVFEFTSNPGFAVHLTNPKNISMFHNGTYHINITLPSWLGPDGNILFLEKFREDHRRFMRLVQWIEPLLISVYGTPDPLSKSISKDKPSPFSRVSQRAAISRYIGIGTYDTTSMSEGKRNTLPVDLAHGAKGDCWWYREYHKKSAYVTPKDIGLDFNYRKHHAHGVELRFLDWFSEEKLEELLRILVCVAGCSQITPLSQDIEYIESWQRTMKELMEWGPEHILGNDYWASLSKALGLESIPFDFSAKDGWSVVKKEILERFQNTTFCRKILS